MLLEHRPPCPDLEFKLHPWLPQLLVTHPSGELKYLGKANHFLGTGFWEGSGAVRVQVFLLLTLNLLGFKLLPPFLFLIPEFFLCLIIMANFFLFESGSYIALASLIFNMWATSCLNCSCWDYRCAPSCLMWLIFILVVITAHSTSRSEWTMFP